MDHFQFECVVPFFCDFILAENVVVIIFLHDLFRITITNLKKGVIISFNPRKDGPFMQNKSNKFQILNLILLFGLTSDPDIEQFLAQNLLKVIFQAELIGDIGGEVCAILFRIVQVKLPQLVLPC
jgi:hypothetical protein